MTDTEARRLAERWVNAWSVNRDYADVRANDAAPILAQHVLDLLTRLETPGLTQGEREVVDWWRGTLVGRYNADALFAIIDRRNTPHRAIEMMQPFSCGDANCNQDRESKTLVVGENVWCDPCIAPLVKALNGGGIKTKASCCGHGHRPATIILADDAFLTITTRADFEKIEALFSGDINEPTSTAGAETLRTTRDKRQAEVISWVRRCFGDGCAEDGPERGARVVEEALELGQAAELPEDRAIHLVRHVYSKPVGKIGQEIGGVSVTLLSFAAYAGLSADEEEAREVARVLSLPVEHFKKRHLEKAADGITKHPSEYAPVTTAPAVDGGGE